MHCILWKNGPVHPLVMGHVWESSVWGIWPQRKSHRASQLIPCYQLQTLGENTWLCEGFPNPGSCSRRKSGVIVGTICPCASFVTFHIIHSHLWSAETPQHCVKRFSKMSRSVCCMGRLQTVYRINEMLRVDVNLNLKCGITPSLRFTHPKRLRFTQGLFSRTDVSLKCSVSSSSLCQSKNSHPTVLWHYERCCMKR